MKEKQEHATHGVARQTKTLRWYCMKESSCKALCKCTLVLVDCVYYQVAVSCLRTLNESIGQLMFLKIQLQFKDSARDMLEVSILIWIRASVIILKYLTESITFKNESENYNHFIIMEYTTRVQHHKKTNTVFLVSTIALYSKICFIACGIFSGKLSICTLCPVFYHEKEQNMDISSPLKLLSTAPTYSEYSWIFL